MLHFASPASPVDYLELPIQTLKVGALGTHKALGLAKAKGARFLLASTSEVYGDPLVHPQREDYWGNVNPVGPRGVYDEAKRFAEAMTMAYHRAHGVTHADRPHLQHLRPADAAARRARDPAFITQALTDQPITVYGDGSQTRSFWYVADLVEGIWRLMKAASTTPSTSATPRDDPAGARQADLRLTGSHSEIVFQPLPVDDPKSGSPTSAAPAPSSAGSRAWTSTRAAPHDRVVPEKLGRESPGHRGRRLHRLPHRGPADR